MRAVVVTRSGGPEVLELQDVPAPEAGPGEVLVDVAFAGVNFRDRLTLMLGPISQVDASYNFNAQGETLASGASVQRVSGDLGYASVTAFITMFRKALGKPPGKYLGSLAQASGRLSSPGSPPVSSE